MRLMTYFANDKTQPAIQTVSGDRVFPLAKLGYLDALDFVAAGEAAWTEAAARANSAADHELVSLSGVRLLPPLLRPGKILCIGLNYRDHAAETRLTLPTIPEVFAKFPSAIIGHGADVVIPAATKKPDYEAELGVVIGKTCHKITTDDWQQYVFGYTIVNDVSARDIQFATTQWCMAKSFDTFCPIGPAIVSKDVITDPGVLDIRLDIDGEILQKSNTRELIFSVPELVVYLAGIITLEAGDIISTGTPSGVGYGRRPQRWLKPGDTMSIEIEGIGRLVNPVATERD